MVYGVLQLINFAHGDIFMVGAIVSFYVASRTLPPTFPWWLHAAVAIGVVLGLAVPMMLGRGWRIAARGVLPFVITYALLVPLIYATSLISRSPHVADSSWTMAFLALMLAITTCGVLGFAIERLAYRPLRDKPRINSLITAIGISLLLEFGGQHRSVFGPTPQPYPSQMVPGISQQYQVIGVVISRVDILVFVVTILLMAILSYVVLKTRTGLGLRAVSHRFDTAALMGVNI